MIDDSIKSIDAIYRVLDFLPDGDPLKNRAKNKALDIMEGLAVLFPEAGWVSLGDYFSSEKKEIAGRLISDADILENYLNMGMRQGWLGGVNFLIASRVCEKIRSEITGKLSRRNLLLSSETKGIQANEPFFVLPIDREKTADSGKTPPQIVDFSERQRKILGIMQKREKTQVADIIAELPDVTKRTIRRDIDDLLKKGKILKAGEWNKTFYQISQS